MKKAAGDKGGSAVMSAVGGGGFDRVEGDERDVDGGGSAA
jgi:hypothetical protein